MVRSMVAQLSFLIRTSAQALTPHVRGSALRVAAHDSGTGQRVTSFGHATLASARSELSAVLAALDPEIPVVDLLLGAEESAKAACVRLAAPVSPTTCLSARHVTLEDRVWIRLFGLYQIGRPDLILAVEPDVPLDAAYDLLTRLGTAHLASPERAPFAPDRPAPFGHWLLGFGGSDLADAAFWAALKAGLGSHHLKGAFDPRMATPAPELVLEAADVSDGEPERYVIGASRAVRTLAAQARAHARLGLPLRFEAPNAADGAVVCDRLAAADAAGVPVGWFAYRDRAHGEVDSGWRIACLDEGHGHDDTTTRLAPLGQLVVARPELVQYLALPEGWVVTREPEGGLWLRAPGDARSFLDEGSLAGESWQVSG